MSSKVSSGNEITGVLYLTNFWFSEFGFIDDFLEAELFSLLGGNSIVEKALKMMKRSGWTFDAMSSDGIWIWSKPGRDSGAYLKIVPNRFIFGISAILSWNFGENRENDREMWADIESEASEPVDIIQREGDLIKRFNSGYLNLFLRPSFIDPSFPQL